MLTTFSILSLIIAVPFLGMIFALTAKEDIRGGSHNIYNVSLFAVVANMVMIWRIFMLIDTRKEGLQLIEKFDWLTHPNIDIIFGVDVFSLLLIFAVHIAFLIGFLGIRNQPQPKAMMVFALLFLSMITGFFVAADIFSFYIFFEAMLLPLFMLMGIYGHIKRSGLIYRFLIYNLIGAMVLFVAVIFLFNHQNGMVELGKVSRLPLEKGVEYFIWGAVFVSLLSRIPVWPFHYWISSINSNIRNPLVFIVSSIVPLTGLYGFIRFLPKTLPDSVGGLVMALEIIGVVTMFFIALIGFINKDRQYKMFSYITVYYIMYLLGVFTRADLIMFNIGFSIFSYLIIVSVLEVISQHVYRQEEDYDINAEGILCKAPRLSLVYTFIVFVAIGLPLSSLFLNNFLIISTLLINNVKIGMAIVLSLVLASATLLQDLYLLKNKDAACALEERPYTPDISVFEYRFLLFVCFVLLMSFIQPLWFVVGS